MTLTSYPPYMEHNLSRITDIKNEHIEIDLGEQEKESCKNIHVSVLNYHILLEVALQIGNHIAERGQFPVSNCCKRTWKVEPVAGAVGLC